ncbi:Mediator of RNA polymerase II transcription subunit 4 [Debaryomyces fabryi]|uniref:Mediator of RNA polymerase II transcription subunit 4 n=1 Tax=Debaryomyces fabryi TaxID=58627 RepID=A0A0V1Q062_9ASCO|nr:Mediator of RNA polymerase II transcription subunit 4 [Debaryomyces fabryi]KSA01901.1 Mediator of RNA polymerase II transcription subunit 4 [Debaryomyces fabryi]CUM53558.1 unnamed protein product [Debaryomyces fabryi]
MIPHRKNDSSFLSVPVSRVGSTQRLNQLASHGVTNGSPNSYNSIPSTPNAYVSSSLNPTKGISTGPETSNQIITKEDRDVFEKLSIVEKVNEFEQNLTNLSFKVSSFKEDELALLIGNLIELNDVICSEIGELEKHRDLGTNIKSLKDKQAHLDNSSKIILKELISYRNDLKKLPRLPSNKNKSSIFPSPNDSKVDVNEVLKYALKLSKFTKAPPTVANLPFQIHPNNYVWPAEDALRRGMLAMSSIRVDDIIKAELGEDSVEVKEEAVKKTEDSKVESRTNSPAAERRGSFVEHTGEPKKQEGHGALDLDLFDPDEEDFSD